MRELQDCNGVRLELGDEVETTAGTAALAAGSVGKLVGVRQGMPGLDLVVKFEDGPEVLLSGGDVRLRTRTVRPREMFQESGN